RQGRGKTVQPSATVSNREQPRTKKFWPLETVQRSARAHGSARGRVGRAKRGPPKKAIYMHSSFCGSTWWRRVLKRVSHDSPDQACTRTLASNEGGSREVVEFRHVVRVDPPRDEQIVYASEPSSDKLPAPNGLASGRGAWMRVGSRRWEHPDPAVRGERVPHDRTLSDERSVAWLRDVDVRVAGFSRILALHGPTDATTSVRAARATRGYADRGTASSRMLLLLRGPLSRFGDVWA